MNSPEHTAITDEQVAQAFYNTNFGKDDHRSIILKGVKSVARQYHNGWTLTVILRELGLAEPRGEDEADLLTEAGLAYIEQATIQSIQAQVDELRKDAGRYKHLRDTPWTGKIADVMEFHRNALFDSVIDEDIAITTATQEAAK